MTRRIRPELLEDDDLPIAFGKYTLLNLIGEGGMARVFRAELSGPQGFKKRAAVKIIHGAVAKRSEKLRRALINEARLGGLLNHPNIVDTYEFGEVDGLPYIAMELVRGVGLDVMLQLVKPVPPAQALEIAIQMCAGLDHAHGLEDDDGNPHLVVHRDLKPSNVLLSRDGLVKIMDFGIAKATSNTYNTTETGMTKGTPAYMSPEQAEGLPLDGRSDLFAFGALLYEMVAGERLFRGENMVQTLMQVLRVEQLLTEEPRWEWLDASVPGLRAVVTRCLRKDRELRYPDALAVEQDLKALARKLPPPAPLKKTVRGLMKKHGLGGNQTVSSVRIALGGGASQESSPAGAAAPAPVPVGGVGPTRAQPVVAPTAAMPPLAPPTPSAPVEVASGDGTLWHGAEAQAASPRRGRGGIVALGVLVLLLLLGGGYALTQRDVVSPAPEPTPRIATVDQLADSLSGEVASKHPDAPPRDPGVDPPPPVEPDPPPREVAEEPADDPVDDPASEEPAEAPDAEKPIAEKPVAEKPAAKPTGTRLVPRDPTPSVQAAKPTARKAVGGPAFDPNDPNLVIEYARVSTLANDNDTWSVRFLARIRGGADATVKVHFNPPGAKWVSKTMRTRDQSTFAESVVFRERNLGSTYWYIEAVRPDGTKANWGTQSDEKKFRIKKEK